MRAGEEVFYTTDGQQWALWVHFEPTLRAQRRTGGWPPIVIERALQFGCVSAVHIIMHQLHGCGFERDRDGTVLFFSGVSMAALGAHSAEIAPEEEMQTWAAELLWVVGDATGVRSGNEPGTFRRHLIDAALSADAENLDRIASAFPELSHVITLWRSRGPAVLEQLADGRV